MANTGFVVNATRVDPYKNFKFRVLWDGKTVLGVSKVGSLKRTTEVVKHRSGGQNSYDTSRPAAPATKASRWSAASLTTSNSRSGRTRCRVMPAMRRWIWPATRRT